MVSEAYIISKLNRMALTISGANNYGEGSPIIIYHEKSGPEAVNQLWKFVPDVDGYYYIKSKLNGMVLDISGGNTGEGSPIIIYHEKSGPEAVNQLWKFYSIAYPTYPQ